MPHSWALNHCQICGVQLAPDDFDGDCGAHPECSECGIVFTSEAEGHLVPDMEEGDFIFICNDCWRVPSAYDDVMEPDSSDVPF